MFPHYIEVSQYRLCFYRIPLWICYDIVCVTPHVRVFLHPSTYAHKHIPKLRRQRTPTQAFPRVLESLWLIHKRREEGEFPRIPCVRME